jgi:hypothetical protein
MTPAGGRLPLGGYFELEPGPSGSELYPGALHLQSARACFQALLRAGRPRRVWIPWYICETMVDQARLAGIEVGRYALEADFTVHADVELGVDEWLLCVDYFGLCGEQVARTIRRFTPARVVVDSSHALHAPPGDCLATIYSPRKFFALPDGGCLVSRLDVPEPQEVDTLSAWRCTPLLKQAAEGPENAYPQYLQCEASLEGLPPLRMSALTRRLLASADYASAAARRRANFMALDKALGTGHAGPLSLAADAVPLAYPYLAGSHRMREFLVSRRVYAQHFWPHLRMGGPEVPPFERSLAESCIPLPCDQRYDEADMASLVSLIREHESADHGGKGGN